VVHADVVDAVPGAELLPDGGEALFGDDVVALELQVLRRCVLGVVALADAPRERRDGAGVLAVRVGLDARDQGVEGLALGGVLDGCQDRLDERGSYNAMAKSA
jgi:hypothetical protein